MAHRQNFPTTPVANAKAVIGGGPDCKYRFTVLTDGLIRYEYADDCTFEDRPSTFAINRALPIPDFRLVEAGPDVKIITSKFHLRYDKGPFTPSGLSVQVKGNITDHQSRWRYGDSDPGLGGTARTLDEANGRVPVGPGVISTKGYVALDDSDTMLFTADGWVTGRRPSAGARARVDGYLFAYGHDYRGALHALYAVSGPQPLLPRWALGNWWSRYYRYTAAEYLALMDRFRSDGIPLSVGVLDMDWHYVEHDMVRASGHSGWTGYSWDRALFPDPPAFLAALHERGVRTTLNVHPADGVASYEDAYADVVAAVGGMDGAVGDPVLFDLTDKSFLDAYFDILHRRLEDDGVDFWWLDWQQGRSSRIPGVDPLWMLNHYHFLDNACDGTRPLTFSRYAGPGSHRYPVGFSGDTEVTWDSLDFQPEFTATASNIGYAWWSHDIGGHFNGYRDDELAARWVQLGVFSPILRLHSSNNPWNSKEPWRFTTESRAAMTHALRLRHQLIPYLYTMNVRAARNGQPLVTPMYWDFPDRSEAYSVPNQFCFGSELMVVPITTARDRVTRRAKARAWLPPGRHVDLFSGIVYDGDCEKQLYRRLEDYAVLAPSGAIVPLDAASEPANGGAHPAHIELKVVVGADGAFDLCEDDGTGAAIAAVAFATTPIVFTQATGTLTIGPVSGPHAFLPPLRSWTITFPAFALTHAKDAHVSVDGGADCPIHITPMHTSDSDTGETSAGDGPAATTANPHATTLTLSSAVPVTSTITLRIGPDPQLAVTDVARYLFDVVDDAQMAFESKKALWAMVTSAKALNVKIGQVLAAGLDEAVVGAVVEVLCADARSGGI